MNIKAKVFIQLLKEELKEFTDSMYIEFYVNSLGEVSRDFESVAKVKTTVKIK